MDLDTRGRQAAASLRHAVDDMAWDPVPAPLEGSEVRPARARRVRWLLVAAPVAIAALVAAVLGIGALHHDDGATPVVSDPGAVPRLVLDPPPAGMSATGAADLPVLPQDPSSVSSVSVWLYGSGGADAPFASADLAVLTSRSDNTSLVANTPGVDTTVRGQPGKWSDDPATGRALQWTEPGGTMMVLATRTLDQAAVTAVAAGLTIAPDGRSVEVSSLPAGLALVAHADDAAVGELAAPILIPRQAVGHVVGYQAVSDPPTSDGSRSVVVATFTAGDGLDLLARWLLGPGEETVDVGGTKGYLSQTNARGVTLTWSPEPGIVAVLGSLGLSRAELLAASAALRTPTTAGWDALVALAKQPTPPPPGTSVLLSGDLPGGDGDTWRLTKSDTGDLCLDVLQGSGGGSTCSGTGPGQTTGEVLGAPSVEGGDDEVHVLYGTAGSGVARVVVQLEGGSSVDAQVGSGYYGAALASGSVAAQVVAMDAGGNVVATVAVVPVGP